MLAQRHTPIKPRGVTSTRPDPLAVLFALDAGGVRPGRWRDLLLEIAAQAQRAADAKATHTPAGRSAVRAW